jgi:hypothetical protein
MPHDASRRAAPTPSGAAIYLGRNEVDWLPAPLKWQHGMLQSAAMILSLVLQRQRDNGANIAALEWTAMAHSAVHEARAAVLASHKPRRGGDRTPTHRATPAAAGPSK